VPWPWTSLCTKIGPVTDERSTSYRRPIEDPVDNLVNGGARRGTLLLRALHDLSRLDQAVYQAVASVPTPTLDMPLRRLSNSANRSMVWVALAGGLASVGGQRGRRAAVAGLVSVVTSSALVNVVLKNLRPRGRPDRIAAGVISTRHTRMPVSSSFPSGHSASGFAFASAVGCQIPALSFPLRILAAAVAYSRVHSGVHYPGDAIVGTLAGGAVGLCVAKQLDRRSAATS
jgi:undecaprenyl-diphosphatase